MEGFEDLRSEGIRNLEGRLLSNRKGIYIFFLMVLDRNRISMMTFDLPC